MECGFETIFKDILIKLIKVARITARIFKIVFAKSSSDNLIYPRISFGFFTHLNFLRRLFDMKGEAWPTFKL